MADVDKFPFAGKVLKADSEESSQRFDELFSPRVALVSFILVALANIALLFVMLRKHLKATSCSAMREHASITAREHEI